MKIYYQKVTKFKLTGCFIMLIGKLRKILVLCVRKKKENSSRAKELINQQAVNFYPYNCVINSRKHNTNSLARKLQNRA